MRPTEFQFVDTDDGPMLQGACPELLVDLLEQLDDEARRAGAIIESWVAPGVQEDVVRERLAAVGLSMPAEVAAWFAWHNGFTSSAPVGSPYPNFGNVSLERAIDGHRRLASFLADLAPDDGPAEVYEFGTGPGWLRLSGETIGLAVDCSTDDALPRIRFSSEDFFWEPVRYRARSLCTWVAGRLYGIRNGAYEWDPSVSRWRIDKGLLLHPTQREAGFS